jgi:AAA15 family ATPase/GTPase
MKSNTPNIPKKNSRIQPASSWQYYATATICCTVLVAGFFLAARQHFSSMEYGLQNSKLRRTLDELQSEKRKLLVTREVSMSPIELRKAVRRIGFMDSPTSSDENIRIQNSSLQKSVVGAVETRKPQTPTNKVVKTVINLPVNKPTVMEKQARRESINSKKDRT